MLAGSVGQHVEHATTTFGDSQNITDGGGKFRQLRLELGYGRRADDILELAANGPFRRARQEVLEVRTGVGDAKAVNIGDQHRAMRLDHIRRVNEFLIAALDSGRRYGELAQLDLHSRSVLAMLATTRFLQARAQRGQHIDRYLVSLHKQSSNCQNFYIMKK